MHRWSGTSPWGWKCWIRTLNLGRRLWVLKRAQSLIYVPVCIMVLLVIISVLSGQSACMIYVCLLMCLMLMATKVYLLKCHLSRNHKSIPKLLENVFKTQFSYNKKSITYWLFWIHQGTCTSSADSPLSEFIFIGMHTFSYKAGPERYEFVKCKE